MKIESLEQRIDKMATATPAAGGGWTGGYKEGGGGFFLASPDQAFMLRILGYVQANWAYLDSNAARIRAGAGRAISNDFFIRRTRMDWLATLYQNTEMFVEFDGGPGTNPTLSAPSGGGAVSGSQSDFALVEARLTQRICDALYLRFGKFTTPFSSENFRSSRAIDTAERYAALNSAFGLPALDVQMGVMAFGNVLNNRLAWYAGTFNGNGRANDNFRDNNSAKEVQLKVVGKPFGGRLSKASVGLGFDRNREAATQTLALATLGGARVASIAGITGDRTGYSADAHIPLGRFDFRTEALTFEFDDPTVDASLFGGFVQASYDVWRGARGASFAPIVRAETAVIDNERTGGQARLNTLTVGWTAWFNSNVRWQVNYLPSTFSSRGGLSTTSANQHFDEVISQIQFKI